MVDKPVVAVLIPEPMRARILAPEPEAELALMADVRSVIGQVSERSLAPLLADATACLTGWGTPPISGEVLAAAPSLELIAHTAGSVRSLLPADAIGHRVRVTHAAALIAPAVAEMVVLQILTSMRKLHRFDAGLRDGEPWSALCDAYPGRLVRGSVIGVVGASLTGRETIALLRGLGARVLVSDPTLSTTDADRLGVELAALDELLAQSNIVTLHAPVLPETRGMIGARELALMRDGALLVNSARAALVDGQALLAELRSGRIQAALDVFDIEPLPEDSELRQLENTVISPHMAGHTIETHLEQGSAMAHEVLRFLRGEPLRYEISPAMVASMA
jgi:phosphoglycerate dehydrogenase-like enzyme